MVRRMVTHWGMSYEVGVVFAASDEAWAALNMRRVDPLEFSSRLQTLALDANGRVVPNGQPNLARQYAFALAAPAVGTPTSPSQASLVDREIKKILDEGHRMAWGILHEHFDQLHHLADALMAREQLNRSEFEALLHA